MEGWKDNGAIGLWFQGKDCERPAIHNPVCEPTFSISEASLFSSRCLVGGQLRWLPVEIFKLMVPIELLSFTGRCMACGQLGWLPVEIFKLMAPIESLSYAYLCSLSGTPNINSPHNQQFHHPTRPTITQAFLLHTTSTICPLLVLWSAGGPTLTGNSLWSRKSGI